METGASFELNKAVSAWRRALRSHEGLWPADIEEITAHLWDAIDAALEKGLSEKEAFEAAAARLGAPDELAHQFGYGRRVASRRLNRIGVPGQVLQLLVSDLRVAWRFLKRKKGHAVISVAGLTLGIMCFLFVLLYVRSEFNYDRYHANSDRIFRVVRTEISDEGTEYSAHSPVPLGPQLEMDFPEAAAFVRFWRGFQVTMSYENRAFQEPGLYFADPEVFDVFSLDLLVGNPASALATPHSIVLTESAAVRYFGDEDPMGKLLEFDGYPGGDSLEFAVSGIMSDLPPNTHLSFTALVSLNGILTEENNWGSFKPIWTYVLLPPNVSPLQLEEKLPAFLDRMWQRDNSETTMQLEPITRIHLYSPYDGGFKPGNRVIFVYLFAAIGLFILLLACVNFVNLATARSVQRSREVGMRKVLGATRPQFVGQFLTETTMMTAISVAAAVVLVDVNMAGFNAVFDTALSFNIFRDALLLVALPVLVVVVAVLAGIYPALVLSRFKPVVALSGQRQPGSSGVGLRRVLVVFQFVVSTVLIVGTFVVDRQLKFLSDQDLGFDREQVVVLPYSPAEEPLLEALRENSSVVSASISQRVPVNTIGSDTRPVTPEGFERAVSVESYIIDEAFLPTLGITVVAGRNFSPDRPSDNQAFLINETAVARFGWASPEQAIGKELMWHDEPGPVVGVVKDFHVASMHERISPVVLQMRPQDQYWRTFVSVKIRTDDLAGTLAFLEQTWRTHTPGGAYRHFFLNDSFEALHSADARFGKIFGVFTLLALGIACLGLFGLTSYTVEQRTKEMGVRKVLGASVPGLISLVSKDISKPIVIAFFIAVPLAYSLMNSWLTDFAYRINLTPTHFLLAGLAAMVVAFLTIGAQVFRAARANPVKSLRSE